MAELSAALPASLGGEGASRVVGFEVAIFQGTNPDLAGNRVRTIECGTNIRDAVIPVSAGDTALTVRAAGRAIYSSGVRSGWSILGPDVIDAFTTPFPTKTEITESLDLNGHEVFFSDTAPASGMVEGDYWFDTTEIVEGGMTRTRYQPYRFDGAAWVAETKAVMVASALAAGIVGAREIKALSITGDQIAANAVTAEKADIDDLIAAMVTVGLLRTSNYAEVCPIDGALLVNGVCPNDGPQDGSPTAGAKLDKDGTALKVAPGNLQIGKYAGSTLWFGVAVGKVTINGAGGASYAGSGILATSVVNYAPIGQNVLKVEWETSRFEPGASPIPLVIPACLPTDGLLNAVPHVISYDYASARIGFRAGGAWLDAGAASGTVIVTLLKAPNV